MCVAACLWVVLGIWAAGGENKVSFEPAEAISVGEISLPSAPGAIGTVVLNAVVVEEGKPQSIEIRRGISGLTELATAAVKDWTFSPAIFKGKPVTSRIAVAVTYSPPGAFPETVSLPPPTPQNDEAIQAEFQPPEVIGAEFVLYPVDSNAAGTVVLEVDLNKEGVPGEVKILKDLPPLTSQAQKTLPKWRFRAATDNGRPVPSKIILVFVSQPWSSPGPNS